MSKYDYDLLVIGAGAAGSTAASTAAGEGVRVALVEKDKPGGTCLNYGCDPTKTLLHTAKLLHQARHARPYGLRIREAEVDWAAVQSRVRKVIRTIRGGTLKEARAGLARQGIAFLEGTARFVSPHEVEVAGKRLRAERFIVATGTSTLVPSIDGLPEGGYLTNVEAVSLRTLPKRMAVLGAGPVGMEFAQLFNRFGVRVTVLQRGPLPLATEDQELAELLCRLLVNEGIRLKTGVELRCVESRGTTRRLNVRYRDGESEQITVDQILLAAGRRPRISSLNLEAAGVKATEKGITVDATLRTNVPHIWAAGDVTGTYQLTHVASEQGELAARNAFAREPRAFDSRVVPWVTYTDPELAHVGKTEEELRREGVEYRVARMPLDKLDRAITTGETQGLVKLLVGKDGRILGGHILAPNAGDLLAPVVLAMRAGLPASTLAETVLPYPTMAEAVRWAADMLD